MDSIFTTEWAREYAGALARSSDFIAAARWFDGVIQFSATDSEGSAWVQIRYGEVASLEQGVHEHATVVLMGKESEWKELFDPATINGTINRFWRQGKIDVKGNIVMAMKFWPVIFWMTEAGDEVGSRV